MNKQCRDFRKMASALFRGERVISLYGSVEAALRAARAFREYLGDSIVEIRNRQRFVVGAGFVHFYSIFENRLGERPTKMHMDSERIFDDVKGFIRDPASTKRVMGAIRQANFDFALCSRSNCEWDKFAGSMVDSSIRMNRRVKQAARKFQDEYMGTWPISSKEDREDQ
tara:strand:+ start:418254 stop:418760 length:507 start_codon:yes stop_codon:yes gene_type:complete